MSRAGRGRALPPESLAGAPVDRDWRQIERDLDAQGCALIPGLVSDTACSALTAAYHDEALFRSRVVMSRHGFGRGESKYFDYPLPGLVADLRTSLYPPLAAIANRWQEALGNKARFPARLAAFLERCRRAGQTRNLRRLDRFTIGIPH